jgi:hypothetical protein
VGFFFAPVTPFAFLLSFGALSRKENLMTEMPPPQGFPQQQPFQPAPQSRTNGWAIASLIFGILGCAFGVPGLIGFILGFVGLKKAKQLGGSGKGMAIGGMIAGVIFMLGWAGCGVAGYWGYQKTFKPTNDAAVAFLNALHDGDMTKAGTYVTASYAASDLQTLASEVKAIGKVKSVTTVQFTAQQPSSGPNMTAAVGGIVEFDNGQTKNYSGEVTGTLGSFKFNEFELR